MNLKLVRQATRVLSTKSNKSSCQDVGQPWAPCIPLKAWWRRRRAKQQTSSEQEDPYVWHKSDFPKRKPLLAIKMTQKRYKEFVAWKAGQAVNLDLIDDPMLRRRLQERDFGPDNPLPKGWKRELAQQVYASTFV